MYALRSLIRTTSFPLPSDAIFTKLLAALRKREIVINHENPATGKVVVGCLSVFINLGLWRCWSDELLIEVKAEHELRTQVSFYAVPKLMRIKVRKGETLTDLETLITQLGSELQIAG